MTCMYSSGTTASKCFSMAGGVSDDGGGDGDGRVAESGGEFHVGGLAADARERFQCFSVVRHFAVVLFQQHAAGGDNIFCLGVVEIDGLDVILEPCLAQLQQRRRRIGDLKQFFGGLVHALVGGLRRQDHRDQQLKGRAVTELGGRMRDGGLEAFEQLSAFFRRLGGDCTSASWSRHDRVTRAAATCQCPRRWLTRERRRPPVRKLSMLGGGGRLVW